MPEFVKHRNRLNAGIGKCLNLSNTGIGQMTELIKCLNWLNIGIGHASELVKHRNRLNAGIGHASESVKHQCGGRSRAPPLQVRMF